MIILLGKQILGKSLGENKMDKKANNLLTNTEFACIIIGGIAEISVLSLPRYVTEVSKQDGWISVAIGSVYPIYIVLLAGYISKKFPNDNILVVSKKCFGNILGTIFNFLFLMQYIVYLTSISADFSSIYRTFVIDFMSNIKVIAVVIAISLYMASKNIKELGRISEIIFYVAILVVFMPLFSLKKSNVLNILPICGSGVIKILKGSLKTLFAYSNAEIIFLIYPFLRDKKNVKKFGLIAVLIVAFIYTWSVFVTIFYLGPEITVKRIWPYMTSAGSVPIPIINNFIFLFMFLWCFVAFRNLALHGFAIQCISSSLYSKFSSKKFLAAIYPVLFGITYYLYPNEIVARNITGTITPILVIYNLIYATAIAILVRFKLSLNKG